MKIAHLIDGQPIEAASDSPTEARCPLCGNVVVLRRRRLMANRGAVYFWRHRANEGRRCPARSNSGLK